jgi:hypothetical protein
MHPFRRQRRALVVEQLESRLAPAIVGTPNQQFVAQVYVDLLKRPVDPTGLAAWTGLLNQGVSRTAVVSLIQTSTEYHMVEVERLYEDLLNRGADPLGLGADLNFLAAGGRIEAVAIAITASSEFYLDSGGTNTGFIDTFYERVLGRDVDSAGLAGWQQVLGAGVPRAEMATLIFNGIEYRTREVNMLYAALLGRTADPFGLAAWAGIEQSQGVDAVIAGIEGSLERFERILANPPQVPGTTPTATTLSALGSTSVGLDTSLQFHITVQPSASGSFRVTGDTVSLRDERRNILGTATLDATGSATLSTAALPAGTHQLAAVFAGDANFAASSSPALPVTVAPASTSVTLLSLTPGVRSDQNVLLQASITSGPSGPLVPTGTIRFVETVNGIATTLDTVQIHGFLVKSDPLSLPAGNHVIDAIYSGDGNFTGSTSSSITQQVNLASAAIPTVTVALAGGSTNPSNLGAAVSFTATVTAPGGVPFTPSGLITFMDDVGHVLGSVKTLDATGAATSDPITLLQGGTRTITAIYNPNGDPNFAGNQGTLQQTITPAATSVSLTTSAPTPLGSSVTFTATVSPTQVGSFTLAAGVSFFATDSHGTTTLLATVTPDATGKAVYTTSSLGAGTYQITAVYNNSGSDPNFAMSTSGAVAQTINPQATTTTLAFTYVGQGMLKLTATVSPSQVGSFTLQAPVTFLVDGSSIGTAMPTNGVATLTTGQLDATTSHTLIASYNGDANFLASSSTSITVTYSDQDDNTPADDNPPDAGNDLFM